MLSSLLLQDKAGMLAIYAMINVVVFISGVFVMLMQAGFMMLETGSLSRKNAINNIFKNFVDLSVCGVAYYLIGYAIFTGESPVVDLMRDLGLARAGDTPEPELIGVSERIGLFFNFAFAATSVTICSGAVTGRIAPHAYLMFGAIYSALIYPIATFTVWNPHGLLYGVYGDFAGSMVVHGLGGFAGLAGALLLGPRIGEHGYGADQLTARRYREASRSNGLHNMPLVALGVIMLWLGWYGFMAGSSFANGYDVSGIDLTSVKARTNFAETVFNDMIFEFGTVVLNATMAPCSAVLATLGFFMLAGHKYNMSDILNGALAGLVAITASADIAGPGEALIIGVVAGVVYVLFVMLMYRLKIDDPVMAFPVHGAVGLAGVLLRVIALDPDQTTETIANQAMYGLGIAAYSFFSAMIIFMLIRVIMRAFKALIGSPHRDYGDFKVNHLRVTPEQELTGLDREVHGQESYNFVDADGSSPTR